VEAELTNAGRPGRHAARATSADAAASPGSRPALPLGQHTGRPAAGPIQPSQPGRHPPAAGPPGATVQRRPGPVALGHRDQLGGVQTAAFTLADQRGGGGLVAVTGGGGHRQPQPLAARQRRRLNGTIRRSAVAVVGGRLDRQMPSKAAQNLQAARLGSAQVRAPGMASWGRQDRARATIAWARAR
jgi:hypothetical protein